MDRKCEWCGKKIPAGEEFYSNEVDGKKIGVFHAQKCRVEASKAGVHGKPVNHANTGAGIGAMLFWAFVIFIAWQACT